MRFKLLICLLLYLRYTFILLHKTTDSLQHSVFKTTWTLESFSNFGNLKLQ